MEETTRFAEWAIVEIMGHQTYAGYVTEQTIGGCAFVRVDVPEVAAVEGDDERAGQAGCEAYSKLFGQGAIYCITPCSEAVARAAVARNRQKPVNVWLPELYPPAEPRRLTPAEAEPFADPDPVETHGPDCPCRQCDPEWEP